LTATPDEFDPNAFAKRLGYPDCECGHNALDHEFPDFFRWFIGLFKGGFMKNMGRCYYCSCPKARNKK
jgi:hypothetical protein